MKGTKDTKDAKDTKFESHHGGKEDRRENPVQLQD